MESFVQTRENVLIPYKILIVDDDELVLESFERVFQEYKNKYSLDKTTNPKKALELIKKKAYDIVITDIVMPEVDGIEVLRDVKKLQPETEVILITAYSSSNSALDAMYLGASDYIPKPFNTSELKLHIERAIAKRKIIAEKNKKINEMEGLSYTISHDLKAIAITLKSFSKMLKDKYSSKLDNNGRFLIDRINANVSSIESIIAEIVEYTKIGKLEVLYDTIKTEDIIDEIIINFDMQLKDNNIDLIVESPLPDVYFYSKGVKHIFSNLIGNSIKYIRKDMKPYIKIGSFPISDQSLDNKFVQFYIEDNGIGISQNNLKRIFDVFQRESKNTDRGGYGIGLAIVKKILETANCSINVKSIPNEKTTFYFTLPNVDKPHSLS